MTSGFYRSQDCQTGLPETRMQAMPLQHYVHVHLARRAATLAAGQR